jgi:hypothetical protein
MAICPSLRTAQSQRGSVLTQAAISKRSCSYEDGSFEVGTDESDTATALAENAGGSCVRTVQFTAQITPPKVEEVEVDVPDEAGETVKTEVA